MWPEALLTLCCGGWLKKKEVKRLEDTHHIKIVEGFFLKRIV